MRPGLLPGLSGVCLIIAILALRSSIATVYAAEDEAPDLMQTLVAGDATLNNNLNLLEPRWIRGSEGREMSFGFGVEKLIAQNLEIEIGGEWDQIWPQQRPSAGGFGNVDFGLKYLFLREGQFQFAVGPTVSFPTNTRIAGEDMQPFAGVDFLWGGRLTGLPHTGWAEYLKAVEIQGDLGYSRSVGAAADDEFHFDPVIDYSFPYLAYVDGAKVPWPTCNLYVFTELNLEHTLRGNGEGPLIFLTPGIAYATRTYQLNAGTQIALNHPTSRHERIGVVGSILIFLDELSPVFAWTPF